jgi:hypothetical protein
VSRSLSEAERRKKIKASYKDIAVVLEGLNRLRKRWKTWGELAARLHCSVSKIQAWREWRNRIYPEDAIRLSINDDSTLEADLVQRADAWLKACGYQWESAKTEAKVSEMTNLEGLIEEGLKEVRYVAELKGLAQTDFDMALSCYLGQKRLGEDIDDWLVKTSGKGTTAFFWRWDDKLPKRFEQQQTRDMIKYLVTALPAEATGQGARGGKRGARVPEQWQPPGKRSDLKVMFLIQVNVDATEEDATKARLTQIEKTFKLSLGLADADAARVEFLYATKRLSHPSDCLVSTCGKRSFACLLSESNTLVANVLGSDVEEMKSAPWSWCGQVILVEGEDRVQKEYLKDREVELGADALLKPGERWKPVDRLFTREESKK